MKWSAINTCSSSFFSTLTADSGCQIYAIHQHTARNQHTRIYNHQLFDPLKCTDLSVCDFHLVVLEQQLWVKILVTGRNILTLR